MDVLGLYRSLRNKLSKTISKLRTSIIKCRCNVVIGKGSIIYWKSPVDVRTGCKLDVGKESEIGRTKRGYHCGMPFPTTLLSDGENSSIVIGDFCRINGAYIHAKKEVRIGNNCVIASGVNIVDSNGHIVNSCDRTIERDDPKEIIIGNNVWIGMNCMVLKGTMIGNNCVVAAGSVVKGCFPDNCVISGNPAEKIRDIDISLN